MNKHDIKVVNDFIPLSAISKIAINDTVTNHVWYEYNGDTYKVTKLDNTSFGPTTDIVCTTDKTKSAYYMPRYNDSAAKLLETLLTLTPTKTTYSVEVRIHVYNLDNKLITSKYLSDFNVDIPQPVRMKLLKQALQWKNQVMDMIYQFNQSKE